MTIVIGLAPGERGDGAARLGVMLAEAAGEDLLVVAVTPTPWPANPQDEEFLATQEYQANQALDRVRGVVESGTPASFVVHPARSVASGLTEIVHQYAPSVVVLGSSARGLVGFVSLGGVAERLLHSLDTPVCIAPVGFERYPTPRLTRVTVGFGRADHDSGLLGVAAVRAEELGLRLRVACFAVRPSTVEVGSIEKTADALVVDEWADQLRADISRSLTNAAYDPARVETVVGSGATLGEAVRAVAWDPGDLLVIGASTSAVSRFFLGSHASKIVRSSPAPVLVLSRPGRR
jgi:nucleotide-binding universal stress UspA family protein